MLDLDGLHLSLIILLMIVIWGGPMIYKKNYIIFEHHSMAVVACDANGNPQIVTSR